MLKEAETYDVIEGFEIACLTPRPQHVLVRWLRREETKGGVIIPQYRQRASYMKGIILAVGPDCNRKLRKGALIQFNGLCDKEFLGAQDPADRDTVFFFRHENVFGLITYDENQKPALEMIGKWLLVKPDDGPGEKAGLLIPEKAGETVRHLSRAWEGKVVSAGEETVSCQEGDRIAYETYGATGILVGSDLHVAVLDDRDPKKSSVLALCEPVEA